MKQTIKEIPEEQRPYEKCYREGAAALSDSELLAVILRTGTLGKSSVALANDIIRYFEDTAYPGINGLLHCSISELMKIHGIGRVKAIQLKCIGEISKRIATRNARAKLCFQHPSSIADYYMEQLRHEEQELMIIMMLDTKSNLISDKVLTKGTVNLTVITPREILIEALRMQAVGIVLIHNHPSGDPTPSQEDQQVTERVQESCQLLGLSLIDHIIIGDRTYYSFVEEGLI